eukprot:m.8131 g.8131  ORF g.8131 m.8131 type:complete len:562 (+) comp3142_c0_seq2:333-2018(+)
MATATCVVLLALALGGACVNAAGDPVQASVDASTKGPAFPHYWKKCVGSGHMLLGTRADWREHLKQAHDDLGFEAIRGHGIFDDDMSVLPQDNGQYYFYNVFQVYDYLLSIGMKPVVELSFMPRALVGCSGNDCHYAFGDHGGYKGLIMPPKDFNKWYDLVYNLAYRLVERYGLDEVASWHFEVWNEMWGVSFPHPYLELYNSSAMALKAVHKSLRVGGPATMQTLDVGDFIKMTKDQNMPVDFVSTHFYPTDPQCQTDDTKDKPDCFASTVLAAQQLAADASLPFFITEYNAGLGGTDRDSPFGAAFVFRNIGLLDKLDMFSFWTFSDVFEEDWMNGIPFHNGYGMKTMHGVPKPAWRAFELLAHAGDTRLPVTGKVSPNNSSETVSVFATGNSTDAGDVQIFAANFLRLGLVSRYSCHKDTKTCVTDPNGPFTDPSLCASNCQTKPGYGPNVAPNDPTPLATKTLTVSISHPANVKLGSTGLMTVVNSTHGNPEALWQSWDSPQFINASQVDALKTASLPLEVTVPVTTVSATESTVTFDIEGYSIAHIAFPSRTTVAK